jgi:tetratricopeptide (TPR) repeat protein
MKPRSPQEEAREEFSPSVKNVLARRVAWHCSRCYALTTGPLSGVDKALNVGAASHIRAASRLGPRYDPLQTRQERTSAANGIWLCRTCATLIDNDPDRYPEERLRAWKTEAERWALDLVERGGAALAASWSGIRVFNLPNTHRVNPDFVPKAEVQRALTTLELGEVLVLCGLGGVGKTQHAVQFAHECRDRVGSVLWAPVDTLQGMHEGLAALADLLELDLPLDEEGSASAKVRAVCAWLVANSGWLLILDNVDSEEVARAIEKVLPFAILGRVVITSRLERWTKAFRVERVNEWNESEGCSFLRKRLAPEVIAQADLPELGRALGWLPLALEHAAAYMTETRVPVAKYLSLLRHDKRVLLSRRHPGMTDYRASVATTWQVSIRRLGQRARDILDLGACLSSEPISRHIFECLDTPVPEEAPRIASSVGNKVPLEPVDNALAELAAYSLITLSSNSIRIHPLLQAVVRSAPPRLPWHFGVWRRIRGLPARELWEGARIAIRAARLFTYDRVVGRHGQFDAVLGMRECAAHIDAILSHLPEREWGHFWERSQLAHALTLYRTELSSYDAGVEVIRSALSLNTAREPRLQSDTDWFLGGFQEFYRQTIRGEDGGHVRHVLRKLPSSDRPAQWTVYEVLRRIAEGVAASGDAPCARRIFRLTWDHTGTDPTASGSDRGHARLAEALALTAETPRDELMSLMEEGLTLLEGEGQLGYHDALRALCLYADRAKTPEQKARAMRLLHLAMPRASELAAYGFGVALMSLRRYVLLLEAGGLPDEALAVCEQFLRAKPPRRDTGRGYRSYVWEWRGDLLRNRSLHLGAARCYEHALRVSKRFMRVDTFREASLRYDSGVAWRLAGRLAPATSQLVRAGEVLSQFWEDADHIETLAALIAIALGRVERASEGDGLIRRALESRAKRLGPDSPMLAEIQRLHGILLYEAGRIGEEEAEALGSLKRAPLGGERAPD